jgi:hypothetical protein
MPTSHDLLLKISGGLPTESIVAGPDVSWARIQGVVLGVVCTSDSKWSVDCERAYKALEEVPSKGLRSEELWNVTLVVVLLALSPPVAREIERDLRGSRKIATTPDKLPSLFGPFVQGHSGRASHSENPIARALSQFAGNDTDLRDALSILLAPRRDRIGVDRLIVLLSKKAH